MILALKTVEVAQIRHKSKTIIRVFNLRFVNLIEEEHVMRTAAINAVNLVLVAFILKRLAEESDTACEENAAERSATSIAVINQLTGVHGVKVSGNILIVEKNAPNRLSVVNDNFDAGSVLTN